MPVRRALVECVVLSVQEGCVFYPCCKDCFSRIDVRHDTTRCRCSRCGSSCLRQQVDYRYRLSMTVARDRRIFGMTVFGGCLNALFGIHASGLQRLVEDSDNSVESPIRTALLVKAVEDCFVGRHFIFGIKVTDAENGPLFGGPTLVDSSARFIANQILLPRGSGPGGCSVVSYYQALLRRETEHPLGTTGPFIASRPSAAALLPVPHHSSPSASFNNTTLPASCLDSTSRQRSLNVEHILSPTPPWQQSLGLITSSAEQEDGCSTQASAGERTQYHYQTHNDPRAPQPTPVCPRGLKGKYEATDPARVPSSPSLPVYQSSSSCRDSPASSVHDVDENPPILHTWLSPFQPGPCRTVPLSAETKEGSDGEQQAEQADASLSDSVAWEDIFSESLGLFLCEQDNGDVDDRFCKTETNLVFHCQGVTASGNPLPGNSQAVVEAVSVCQSKAQLTGIHPHRSVLLEITNPVDRSHRVDLVPNPSPQTYRDLSGNENESLSCDQDGVYDCSADLFSGSLAQTPRTQRNTDSHMKEAHLLQPTLYTQVNHNRMGTFDMDSRAHTQEMQDCETSPDVVHSDGSYVADTQGHNDAKTTMEDCDHFQCLDFIPPTQSTPLVKRAGHAGLLVPTHASGLLNLQPNRVDSYGSHMCTPLRTTTLRRLKRLRAHLLINCAKRNLPFSVEPSKHSHKSKHKSSFWRLDQKSKHCVKAQKGPAEKMGPNLTSVYDMTVQDRGSCDNDDTSARERENNAVTVSSHTTRKTRGPVKCRPREWTDVSRGDFEHTQKRQQTDNHKINYLDMTTTPKTELVHRRTGNGVCNPPGGCERAGSSQNTSGGEVNLNGSVSHLAEEESEAAEAYDLSRDLFTDSF